MLRNIWVVGGDSGIGAAVARTLSMDSRRVVPGAYVSGRSVDVRKPSELHLFEHDNGPFDGLVYSAGITELDWLRNILPQTMQDMFHVNVTGLVNVLQACDESRGRPLRRVVVIGSDAAWRPMRTSTAYCASKAALHAAVACIARERASEDFAINVVAPGITEPTEMASYIDERVPLIRDWSVDRAQEYERSQIPLGRRATVMEVAEVVCSVLATNTPYLNGAVIPVNGAR